MLVQHTLLSIPPTASGYEFAASYEPAVEVGGDYYDFMPLADGKLAITLADVTGRGIQAAGLMTRLSRDAKCCHLMETNPAKVLTRLNSLLCPRTSTLDRYVTIVTAILDPITHTVTLASAGHQPPVISRKANASVEYSMPRETPGLPLGLLEDAEYGGCPIILQPGACLIMHSDGVSAAMNMQNGPFGNDGIKSTIQGGGPITAKALGERLVKAVKNFAAGRAQHGEITLVCFNRNA